MSDIVKRLQGSLALDAINGDTAERAVCASQMREAAAEITRLREELDRHNAWQWIMQLVEKHYPAAVFDGSSATPGARLVVALREITRLRERCEALEDLRLQSCDSLCSIINGHACSCGGVADKPCWKCAIENLADDLAKEPGHAD